MMRTEREELLRRYLEGEMSLEQEHDFFIQVALDKELRHELKAQQTIDRAFQKDRVVDPSCYASLQVSVAGIVAASGQKEPAPASLGPVAARSAGTPLRRMIVGGLGGLAILATLTVYGLVGPASEESSPKERAVATVPPPVHQSERSRDDRAMIEAETSAPAEEAIGNSMTGRIAPRSTSQASPSRAHSRREIESAAFNNDAHQPEIPAANTEAALVADTSVDKSVLEAQTNDSLPVGVKLRWKR